MLQACLIYIGLSLDSFIVMMQKGAQLRNLSGKKMAGYSLLYAVISVMMLTFGYGLSNAFLGFVPDGRLEIAIACLVILSVGIWLMTKSFKKSISSELLFICINYGSDRVKYLSDSLMELGLSRVFLNYLFDYFINIRHKFILL